MSNFSFSRVWYWQLLPLMGCAWLCIQLAAQPILVSYGISSLTVAIVVGMLAGNLLPTSWLLLVSDGIQFSKAKLLRLGIILYGFKITVTQLTQAGGAALLSDAAVLCSTFLLALWLGKRLGIDSNTAALVGAGSSICGAAAVLATQPVLKAKESDTGVAVATVVVFGTLAMFVYPLLAALILPKNGGDASWFAWGIFTGSSIHEVAQVAAAGAAVNKTVADVAVITKMIRVMMLAPFLLVLPWVMQKWGGVTAGVQSNRLTVPWFAVGFIVVALLNSQIVFPNEAYRAAIIDVDTFLLVMAMFALGATTRWQSVKQAGVKPLLLAGVLAVWLLVGGAMFSYFACFLFQN